MSLSESERRYFTRQGRSSDAADAIARNRIDAAVLRAAKAIASWEDTEGHICVAAHERDELARDIAKAIRAVPA